MQVLTSDKNALRCLKRDPVLKPLISAIALTHLRSDTDLYRSLLRSVVGQQLSVKAAAAIWKKFETRFSGSYPAPKLLISFTTQELKECGLSTQKANYLQNIAHFFLQHPIIFEKAHLYSDEELIKELTQIKGVGRWTVEMLLMFSLERPDVFPIDDFGIMNGISSLYKLRTKGKRKRTQRILRIAETWRPYRSLACLYIWRYKDLVVSPPKKRAAQKAAPSKKK